MSKLSFNVSLTPQEALDLVRDNQDSDLVHEEYNDVGEDRMIGTQIYEKYYFRSSNCAALIVIVDNIQGITNVRAISTGSSNGMIFRLDWGAAKNFVSTVEKILEEYIIEDE